MLIRDIMRSPAVAIFADTTLQDAYRTMREQGIRHLPVLEGEKLVGVVTDRDLRLATSALTPSPFLPDSRVSAVSGAHDAGAEDRLPPGHGRRTVDRDRHGPRLAGRLDTPDGSSQALGPPGSAAPRPSRRARPAHELRQPPQPERPLDSDVSRQSRLGADRPAHRLDRDQAARAGPAPCRVRRPVAAGEAVPSVIYAPAYRKYSFGDEHPFSPVRTDMMLDLLGALGHRVETVEPEPATREDLLDVHQDAYVCRVEKLSAGALVPDGQEYGLGTQDTPSFPGMDEAARWLVGGTLHGARLILEGRERRVLQLGGGLHHARHAA